MRRAGTRALVATAALAALVALPGRAHADDEFAGASVIFARGAALYRVDPRGKGETEVATLPAKAAVRALRTDAEGKVLLADLGGKWSWMPLDGKAKALTELACADGPAQLAEDGTCVLCRGPRGGSIIINLHTGKDRAVDVPSTGARLVGTGADRRVVWADKAGVWSALARDPRQRQQVAPEAPLRSFLPSPDGTRGLGVFLDKVYTSVKDTKPAELLMGFALDGQATRRKAIKGGVPIQWSHDSRWVLVQDGGSACIMMAMGGQYKCWRGYTGASVAADGRWGLVLGNRDGSKQGASKGAPKAQGKAPPASKAKGPAKGAEPTDEPEGAEDAGSGGVDDVEVSPPSGPLALYRTRLEGAFTDPPALIAKVVDGAAVWVPAAPQQP